MDFSIIPAGLPLFPLEERDRRKRSDPRGITPIPWAGPPQNILLKGFKPVGNTIYIDVEFDEIIYAGGSTSNRTVRPNLPLQKALNLYSKAAHEKQPPKHTIDLVV